MIVTCPVCSTRYLVDPRALGTTGRLVRCANCAHTWQQTPPADAPLRVDVSPPALEPTLEPAPRGEARANVPMVPPPPPPRRTPWAAIVWGVLILALVGIGAGAVWERDRIAALWPPAARFYAMAGLPVARPGSGLELRKVTPSRETENGLPTLVIKGEVVNVSPVAREVPKLRVVLRDINDRELQAWTFSVTDERLLPGAAVPFRTSVAQPSEAATGVVVTFAGNDG